MTLLKTIWEIILAFIRSFTRITISDPQNHIILITGCDSGFGLMTVYRLLQQRYFVVALCLTEKGVSELQEYIKTNGFNDHCVVLRCDVTKEEDIKKVYEKVEGLLTSHKSLKLWALVNNAGIAPSGFVDWLGMEYFRTTMEVNFFAIVGLTKLFLPFLKKSKNSRIINICSMAGFVGGPNGAPYVASKHALEGFTKCLRLELMPWNIHVTNINPGFMSTGIVKKSLEFRIKEFEKVPKDIRDQYPIHNLTAGDDMIDAVSEHPSYVVNCILDNITRTVPLQNNFPGINTKIASWSDWSQSSLSKHLFGVWMVYWFNFGPYPKVVEELQSDKKE